MDKANTKGFTLVELLAVIIVLGIIATIGGIGISSIIKNSQQKAYEQQVDAILKAAKEWAVENTHRLPNSGSTSVPLSDLISSGKLTDYPENPMTSSEQMDGYVLISCATVSCVSYEYKYIEN